MPEFINIHDAQMGDIRKRVWREQIFLQELQKIMEKSFFNLEQAKAIKVKGISSEQLSETLNSLYEDGFLTITYIKGITHYQIK